MCGIVGRASGSLLDSKKSWVKDGNNLIKHRGPDAHAHWISKDSKVEFCHRRLSIMDISELGSQPMLDSESNICLIFNGEIYNFKELRNQLMQKGYFFKSNCDTEIIIASYREWGRECLNKFNGMFVFALYDPKSGDVFIARDRAGEKPLYYSIDNSGISFASEIKALLENPSISRLVDKSSLDCYLMFGFVPGSRSIYSSIKKLDAGSWLTFNVFSGKLHLEKYWKLPIRKQQVNISYNKNELLEQFESLFKDAISKQLVADVPVGVLLSGGLDSSLVTAVASNLTDKLKTFNVRFPGAGKLDETEHARAIADYYGTEHIELIADNTNPELLNTLSKQYDEPIIDSSMIPTYLVSQEVRKHCKVALGGDGADELFGGYCHYEKLLKIQKILKLIPFTFQRNIPSLSSSIMPDDYKGKNWIESLVYNYDSEAPLVASYFDLESRKEIFGFDYLENAVAADQIYKEHSSNGEDLIDRATRTDFKTYLTEDILVKVDRASMLSSLEIRAPFLDYRIIEFAFSKIPTHLKVNNSNKKIFLQNYASKILPKNFFFGRKQGFSIPLNTWLQKGVFKDFFYDNLLANDCIFNRKYIKKILKDNAKGIDNGEKIFGLLMLELWRKNYRAKI